MAELALSRNPAHMRHGSNIGQPLTRREGVLKVTGEARYAADHHPPGMLYAVMATAGIARGRVTGLDVQAANAHPGVVEVMTQANRPALAQDPDEKNNPFMFRLDLLQSDQVRYANQPIAVVIAATLEAATEGAALLAPRYEAEPTRVGLDDNDSFVPPAVGVGHPPEVRHGDVPAGLAQAAQRVEQVYETPQQYHNAMEPHAIVATWDGDQLSVDTPSQGMAMAQARIAGLFGIPPEQVHIRSPFLGGGFGSKGLISGPQILGILAARLVGRPVKLTLKREQMFGPVGHRSATRQTIRMGAAADGTLTAIEHHAKIASSTFDDFFEAAADVARTLYNSPAIATTYDAVRLDTGTPLFMRAPGEAPGNGALESAIDEMAEQCGMDPLAFRLRNYAEVEPISGKPFSSKALRECYKQGAARFGWAGRLLQPRQMQDEAGLLVGWGVGTATFPAIMFAAKARAVLRADGSGVMEIGAHDMGQGAWTALAQIAADGLGLALDRLEFRSGSSDLPDAGIAQRELRGDPGPGGACGHRRPRQRRGGPGGAVRLRDARARGGVCRGEGGSGFRANPLHAAARRVCRRNDHQPAPGAEPVLRRNGVGIVVCTARTRSDGPAQRPDDEPQPRRVSCAGERGRALAGGGAGGGTRPARERAGHQGSGRDRHHRHRGRRRQRRLARNRRAGAPLPDHAGRADRGGSLVPRR